MTQRFQILNLKPFPICNILKKRSNRFYVQMFSDSETQHKYCSKKHCTNIVALDFAFTLVDEQVCLTKSKSSSSSDIRKEINN